MPDPRWRARLWTLLGVGALIGAVAAGWFVVAALREPMSVSDRAAVIGLVLAYVSAWVSVASLRAAARTARDDPDGRRAEAVAELARRARARWDAEAMSRGLVLPAPLRVAWRSTARGVMAAAHEILPGGEHRPLRLKLRGDVGGLAALWRRLPARQLVVIGEAGSGKTSALVLLVRELLRDPAAGVPLLLNLADWHPRTPGEPIGDWITASLEAQYAFLREKEGPGGTVAARLVADGVVVPVLDGLDELPERLRAVAVGELARLAGDTGPLVLTCRGDQYEAAVAERGRPLARALVVELDPVEVPDLAVYLPAGQIDGAARWAPVTRRLREEPDGVLARVLSVPLMAFLARTVYGRPDADPGELTALGADEVERRLLDGYVRVVYADGDARRWLTYVARRLVDAGGELAWWRVIEAVPGYRLVLGGVLALLTGMVVAGGVAVAGMAGSSRWAGSILTMVIIGHIFGYAAMLGPAVIALGRPPGPHRFGMRLGAIGVPVAWIWSLLALLMVREAMGGYLSVGEASAFGLAAAGAVVVIAAMASLGRPVRVAELRGPRSSMRQDRRRVLAGAGVTGAVLGLLAAAGEITAVLLRALDLSPAMQAIAERPVVLAVMAAYLTVGFGASCVLGVVSSSLVASAWGRYALARWILAATGRTPWRLTRFLEDAHRRGVLRQVGAVYQFRHEIVRRHLAG